MPDLGFGGRPGGSEAEEDSGEDGDRGGEDEDGPVEGDVEVGLLPRVAKEPGDCGSSHEVEEEASHSAHEGDHEAFGEDLAEDSGTPCAESKADTHFALAGGGSGEHEIGDVGAGEEKDETDESQQDVDGLREVTRGEVQTATAVVKMELGHGVVFFESRHGVADGCADGEVEGDLGLGDGDFRPGPRHELHPKYPGVRVERAADELGVQQLNHRERHEEFGGALDAFGSGEAGWVHSDDGDGNGIDVDDFADHVGRAAKVTLPESVADDGDSSGAGGVVVGGEDGAAESGSDLHLLVKVSGDEFELDGAGLSIDGDVGAADVFEGEDVLEDAIVFFELLVDGIGEGVEGCPSVWEAIPVSPGGVDGYVPVAGEGKEAKLLGVRDAEAFVEHFVGDGEDGGVGSDGQRERAYGDGGEAGAFAKDARGVAEVAPEIVDPAEAEPVAHLVFVGGYGAELEAGLAGGFLRG